MRRLVVLISLVASLSLSGFNYKGYDFEVDDIYYNIIDEEPNTVHVTCGDKTFEPPEPDKPDMFKVSEFEPFMWLGNTYKGDVVIPSTVTYNGVEYVVTAIGDGAFVKCDELISVTAPETVVSVGDYAFFRSNVRRVYLSDNVVSLGKSIFTECCYMESFDVPESLKTIPKYCFDCSGEKKGNFIVHNLGNITRIEYGAFKDCAIKSFDFGDTAITGAADVGESLFLWSKIEEIVLPSDWAEPDYTDLMNKLFLSVPAHLKSMVLSRDIPPSIDESEITVSPELFTQVSLKVPQHSLFLYQTSPFWRKFVNTTGVKEVYDDGEAENSLPEYYGLDGVKVSSDNLPPVYIERRGKEVRKCHR